MTTKLRAPRERRALASTEPGVRSAPSDDLGESLGQDTRKYPILLHSVTIDYKETVILSANSQRGADGWSIDIHPPERRNACQSDRNSTIIGPASHGECLLSATQRQIGPSWTSEWSASPGAQHERIES